MKSIKTSLTKNQKVSFVFTSLVLSLAVANIILQLFLRFLLTDWFRVAWISLVVYLALFPLNYWLVKKIKHQLPPKSFDRHLLFGLSLLISSLIYLGFPIKVTGNLLLLSNAPLWLYRITRLVNILSFFLSAGFSFLLVLVSISQKTEDRHGWWIAAISVFTLLLMVGLLVFKDYGISSDEPNERVNGLVSAHYVASYIEEKLLEPDPYIPNLSTYRYRYYGVAYQVPLAVIENNTLTRGLEIWHFRHLANFLFYYLGVLAFFHLAAEFFQDARFGLLGSVFLILSPRLFAHAFFNPKDTIFMAAFTIALYFCARFWRRKAYGNAVLAGIACAFAANIRVIALALVVITLGMLLLELINEKKRAEWKQTLLHFLVFVIFLILFWPAAWQAPLATLGQAIRLFSDYTYWDFRVMYMGQFMRGAQAPWHYLPVWMGITIPLPDIVFFFIGFAVMFALLFRERKHLLRDYDARMRAVILGIFLFPSLLAILLGSTLYNGWRHFQFIYPAFLLIALAGLRSVLSRIDIANFKKAWTIPLLLLLSLSGIQLILTGFWMIRYHPHQAVYFNQIGHLVGRENFERDYWRISVKEGLEYLLTNDSSVDINICMESQFEDPEYLMILPEEDRSRINLITNPAYFDACNYAVNTYRRPDQFECEELFYEINAEGLPFLTITKCLE